MSRTILYAIPFSLYSAKARSYMIKQHIDFAEISQGSQRFMEKVLPEIGRMIIPVMETGDGIIVQDGTAIIDWFEHRGPQRQPATPDTPRHRIIAHIFELFGGEGLLRPAMHYRWSFPDENLDFLTDQFATFILPSMEPAPAREFAEKIMGKMQQAAHGFGVSPETASAIEEGYLAFLSELEAHFRAHPYLLGGRPTLGDYGLLGPLYPHLGRDPVPAQIMKDKARAVMGWIERMNQPGPAFPEFPDRTETLFEDDRVPDTLMTLLKRVGQQYGPELEAMVGFTNGWLADNNPEAGSIVGGDKQMRVIGECEFMVDGTPYKAWVMPFRIWMLQRIQDAYDALEGADKDSVDALLSETGLTGFVTTRATRRVDRANNREVWA